jgi:hypothetical protein
VAIVEDPHRVRLAGGWVHSEGKGILLFFFRCETPDANLGEPDGYGGWVDGRG